MIIELFLTTVVAVIQSFLSLLPDIPALPDWFGACCTLLRYGLFFFPADVWFALIGYLIFKTVLLNSWALIEWIYKKIPGVS